MFIGITEYHIDTTNQNPRPTRIFSDLYLFTNKAILLLYKKWTVFGPNIARNQNNISLACKSLVVSICGYFLYENTPILAKPQSSFVCEKVYIWEDAYRSRILIGGINISFCNINENACRNTLCFQEVWVFSPGEFSNNIRLYGY